MLPRSGGGGDFVTNVFVLGQRFDFATFGVLDVGEEIPTRGAFDENGDPTSAAYTYFEVQDRDFEPSATLSL